MRLLLSFLSLALYAATAQAQPDLTPPLPPIPFPAAPNVPVAPRPGTPQEQIKADLTQFVNNLNLNLAYMGNNDFIYEVKAGYMGANEWAKNWKAAGIQVTLDDIAIDNPEDKKATVTLRYHLQSGQGPLNELLEARFKDGFSETLNLQKETVWRQLKWQIVPPKELDPTNPETGIFAYVATVLAQKGAVPTDALPYTFNTEGARSLQNLKQLSLGVLQFTQDYDEIYAFQPQYVQEALTPYVKSTQIFGIPASQQSYSFNANLSGNSLAAVAEPARTVLFYEGKDQQPVFRYQGKAAIAFADGHCALVNPQDLKTAIWDLQVGTKRDW